MVYEWMDRSVGGWVEIKKTKCKAERIDEQMDKYRLIEDNLYDISLHLKNEKPIAFINHNGT